MLDKEIIRNTKQRYTREEARELLTKTWLERPQEQRNHLAAERFVQQAAQDFQFKSEEPREILIRGWIQPYTFRIEHKDDAPWFRWLNRPWFERSVWPLRLLGLGWLSYCIYKLFWNLAEGQFAFGLSWLLLTAPAALLLSAIWTVSNRNR
ncbi:MAG: hypothetical protein AAGE01_09900 [Pseudomonadota bacterium]